MTEVCGRVKTLVIGPKAKRPLREVLAVRAEAGQGLVGGNDFVSLNYYETAARPLLKPCEMPAEKVIAFIENVRP